MKSIYKKLLLLLFTAPQLIAIPFHSPVIGKYLFKQAPMPIQNFLQQPDSPHFLLLADEDLQCALTTTTMLFNEFEQWPIFFPGDIVDKLDDIKIPNLIKEMQRLIDINTDSDIYFVLNNIESYLQSDYFTNNSIFYDYLRSLLENPRISSKIYIVYITKIDQISEQLLKISEGNIICLQKPNTKQRTEFVDIIAEALECTIQKDAKDYLVQQTKNKSYSHIDLMMRTALISLQKTTNRVIDKKSIDYSLKTLELIKVQKPCELNFDLNKYLQYLAGLTVIQGVFAGVAFWAASTWYK